MSLFRAAFAPLQAAWTAGRWATRGGTLRGNLARGVMRHAGPTMLGAGVGGTIGAFRGDVSGEARIGEIFKHAALGAMGGAGIHAGFKFGPGIIKRGWRSGLSSGWGTTKATGRGAFRAGRFAFEHPLLAGGGIALAGGGLYAAGSGGATPRTSPTMAGAVANINYDQQAMARSEMMMGSIAPMGFTGTAPEFQQYQQQQMYRERLKNSTQGLVQGLHRSRH